MKALEDRSEELGVSKGQLMENAGKAFYDFVKDRCFDKSIAIFCGQGNNGGDGFVIARLLAEIAEVTVVFLGKEEKLSKESKPNYEKVRQNASIRIVNDLSSLEKYDICIDAMLGTGVEGELREPIRSAIMKFNNLDGYKICVDIPSGVDPDTGKHSIIFCRCDLLITFHNIKKGLVGLNVKTEVVNIGIPEEAKV